MLKLLIDECCSPELVAVGLTRGHEATHVTYLGLAGKPDHMLLPVIVGGDHTFVTNNRKDFLRLYRHVEVHAGLLIIVPSVNWIKQIELFNKVLDAIETTNFDTVNQRIEVSMDGSVTMSQWPFDVSNTP